MALINQYDSVKASAGRDPQITRELDQLEKAVGSLDSAISMLLPRLEDVMHPAQPILAQKDGREVAAPNAPLAESLITLKVKIFNLESQIKTAHERLEI